MTPEAADALAAFGERISDIERRFTIQEEKIDKMLLLVERANGAWIVAKWLGAVMIGVTALWQFGIEHIRFK